MSNGYLFHHQQPLTCFGKVFGHDATTTATANDHHICLNNLWLVTQWDLQESENTRSSYMVNRGHGNQWELTAEQESFEAMELRGE